MTRRTNLLLLVCCLTGLVASVTASVVHYRLLSDPGYSSFCDINETWNCAAVYESRFGSIAGVPVAVAGVIWFVAATLLVLAGWRAGRDDAPAPRARKATVQAAPSFAESAPAYLFVLSVVGLAVVLYLAYASFFVLKTYCVLCILTYAAVTGIFILAGSSRSANTVPMRTLPARAVSDLGAALRSPLALTAILLLAVGAISAVAFFPRASRPGPQTVAVSAAAGQGLTADQQAEFEKWYSSQPRVALDVPRGNAKVVVVKFNDYQCPPCRQTYEAYKPVLEKWQAQQPGAVAFVTKDYPLEPECNVNAPGGQHFAACEAAAAVRLAREKGRAEAMEAWLFENQPSLSPSLVREGAREIGRVTDFDSRYAATLELVRADIAQGAKLGVRGTPTFFINGVRIPGIRAEYFDAAIAYELRLAQSQ
ncbi:MAG TPA: vitamin K epoxide reductase family protein [Vicinamibacterales bacterium]|nr:vitamin K epoxide reductase family protein [Vicinamibacterales bacterium]